MVVQTNVSIKNSSDNLTKSFIIREMYGCQCTIVHKENKSHLLSAMICWLTKTSSSHPPEGEEASTTVNYFKNALSEWSIDSTATFPCKNKIQVMTLAVL